MDRWSALSEWSWCTTRVCDGSVAEVATLIECYGAGGARFTVPDGTLAFDMPDDRRSGAVTQVGPRRIHSARLRYARWRPAARVTVEVEPWSAGSCEVLVRPRCRLPQAPDGYFRAAVATITALAAELEQDRHGAPVRSSARMTRLREAS